MEYRLTPSRRIKSTPFTSRNELNGVKAYTVYNKTLLPTIFNSMIDDYYHLLEYVQLWDVSCQKIIQIKGPDAFHILSLISCRDLSRAEPGKCYYTPITNSKGGLLNDTLVLCIEKDCYWVSISDSDIYLWISGILTNLNLKVVVEPKNIATIAVQGPSSNALLRELAGYELDKLNFFNFDEFKIKNRNFFISRTGFSKQGGYEIYIQNFKHGKSLWDLIVQEGFKFNLKVGTVNLIERVESGLLSYGNDMTDNDTPLDCSLAKYCSLESDYNFIGKNALLRQKKNGPDRDIYKVFFEAPLGLDNHEAVCYIEEKRVGKLTSLIFSPKYNKYLGFIITKKINFIGEKEIFIKIKNGIFKASVESLD